MRLQEAPLAELSRAVATAKVRVQAWREHVWVTIVSPKLCRERGICKRLTLRWRSITDGA